MQLEEIRETINQIDKESKRLFEERLIQSRNVADSKMETGDEVYKPLREKEMTEKHSSIDDSWYLMNLRKIVEISRKYQYSKFIEDGCEDPAFLESLSKENREVLANGGRLALSLKTDRDSMKGLNVQGVLSLVSSTSLRVEHLVADEESGNVRVTFYVDNTPKAKDEAHVLAYMLFKETLPDNNI